MPPSTISIRLSRSAACFQRSAQAASCTASFVAAAQHEAQLAIAPGGLPTAARNAVFRSMLKHGLLAENPAPQE